MANEFKHPDGLMADVQYGFTHCGVATGSKTVYAGGQVAWDADENLVGGNDLGAQLEQCFKNVAIALAAGGATPADVVRQHVYLVDHTPDDVGAIVEKTNAFYAPGEPPPSTLVGVARLALPDFLCEVEATAVID